MSTFVCLNNYYHVDRQVFAYFNWLYSLFISQFPMGFHIWILLVEMNWVIYNLGNMNYLFWNDAKPMKLFSVFTGQLSSYRNTQDKQNS